MAAIDIFVVCDVVVYGVCEVRFSAGFLQATDAGVRRLREGLSHQTRNALTPEYLFTRFKISTIEATIGPSLI